MCSAAVSTVAEAAEGLDEEEMEMEMELIRFVTCRVPGLWRVTSKGGVGVRGQGCARPRKSRHVRLL